MDRRLAKKTLERSDQNSEFNSSESRYIENIFISISLTGKIIPWKKILRGGRKSEFKLVCSNSLDYFFEENSEWHDTLQKYCHQEVCVIGLLNLSDRIIVPQRIFPKGALEDNENVIDLALWRSRKIAKKLMKNVNDLILIPAAVCAVMMS